MPPSDARQSNSFSPYVAHDDIMWCILDSFHQFIYPSSLCMVLDRPTFWSRSHGTVEPRATFGLRFHLSMKALSISHLLKYLDHVTESNHFTMLQQFAKVQCSGVLSHPVACIRTIIFLPRAPPSTFGNWQEMSQEQLDHLQQMFVHVDNDYLKHILNEHGWRERSNTYSYTEVPNTTTQSKLKADELHAKEFQGGLPRMHRRTPVPYKQSFFVDTTSRWRAKWKVLDSSVYIRSNDNAHIKLHVYPFLTKNVIFHSRWIVFSSKWCWVASQSDIVNQINLGSSLTHIIAPLMTH